MAQGKLTGADLQDLAIASARRQVMAQPPLLEKGFQTVYAIGGWEASILRQDPETKQADSQHALRAVLHDATARFILLHASVVGGLGELESLLAGTSQEKIVYLESGI